MYIVQSELDFRGITTTTTKLYSSTQVISTIICPPASRKLIEAKVGRGTHSEKCSVDDTVDVILKLWPLSMRDDSGVVPSFISTPLEFPQSSNPTQLNQTWV